HWAPPTVRSSRQLPAVEEFCPQPEPPGVVHRQDKDRRSAGRCQAVDGNASEYEMVGPPVAPRVVERYEVAGHRVDPGQVRRLVQVTAVAGEDEVFGVVGAAVLLGDDVLDVVRQDAMPLTEKAAFTTVVRATPDECPRGGVHR